MTPIQSGKLFEKNLYSFLVEKYPHASVKEQVKVGQKIGTHKKYVVDFLVDNEVLVSAKYQAVGGTAEQKIPHEIITLQHLCDTYGFKKAYIVYDGAGFTLMESYRSISMSKYIQSPNVVLCSFEEFTKECLNEKVAA